MTGFAPAIRSPICLALDMPDAEGAAAMARALRDEIGLVKVGMEFFYAAGPHGYQRIAGEGVPVFLDLKLHDIPNTVRNGLAALMRLDPAPAIVNVHATGGPDMMRAAADAVRGRARLIAVTILTSLSQDDVRRAGFDPSASTRELAMRLAREAKAAGLDGVVCSRDDLAGVRAACGRDFLTVVPGIRPQDTGVHDQKRIATPRAALDAGADVLVIGRPITGAADPKRAARVILDSLGAQR